MLQMPLNISSLRIEVVIMKLRKSSYAGVRRLVFKQKSANGIRSFILSKVLE